jgi:hypothetical protein
VGRLVGELLSDRSRAVQVCGTTLAWVAWALGLAALAVPLPVGLVVSRVVASVGAVTGVVAAIRTDASTALKAIGLAIAVAVVAVVFHPETGSLFANGPAYPNERRFLLRPPAVLLLGPIPLAGALVGAGAVAGPLLLSARNWWLGSILTVVGFALVYLLGRSLHSMVRRFVVLVPAGFVLHDALALRDPVLFSRRTVERMRAAPADSDSLDLSHGAAGLAVEVLLTEKVPVVLTNTKIPGGEAGSTARFLVTPTRPGLLLATATKQRFTVS